MGEEVIYKIYRITNTINGKIYIGQTMRQLNDRFNEHSHADTPLGRAIRKYGKDNFTIEVIEECDNIDTTNEREKFFIAKFDCKTPKGYNQSNGGFGNSGYVHTEEIKKFLSDITTERYKNPEAHEKSSEGQKRRWADPAEHEKASIAGKRRWSDPNERIKMSERATARCQVPSEKARMSEMAKKRWADPDEHDRASKTSKKLWDDPARHERARETSKKRWSDPNEHKKTSEAVKNGWAKRKAKIKQIEAFLAWLIFLYNTNKD